MKSFPLQLMVAVVTLVLAPLHSNAVGEETKKITAKTLELEVPASWKKVDTSSRFRAAQLSVPNSDGEASELVIYHFGGATGGIKANIDRWVGQFHEKGRSVKITSGESTQGAYYLAEVAGTWKKPDGPPFAQKTIDKPGSRVIGVILVTKAPKDYYFFKFSGEDKHVAANADALRATFGGKSAGEKPFTPAD